MTEQEMIDAKFEKIDVSTEESGDETSYYYYRATLTENIILISNASDEASEEYSLYEHDLNIRIRSIQDFNRIKKILTRNK
jgi:hypothetical protein